MNEQLIVFSDAQGWICTCGDSGQNITGSSAARAANVHAHRHAWANGPFCKHIDIRQIITQQENAARSEAT